MKYIRTKYGVYEIIEEDLTMYYCNDNNRCLDKIHNLIIFDAHRKDEKDIMVADTIEELCDEFVYCYRDDMPILVNEEQIKQLILIGRIQDVRGAIWTSKGLIYVAKMNSEGCLELI